VLGMMRWRLMAKVGLTVILVGVLGLSGWGDRFGSGAAIAAPRPVAKLSSKVFETAPPQLIEELQAEFADNQPQVKILEPKASETLQDDTVSVRFQVKDLTLFKNEKFGLGPHLHVILDNQTYQAVYDLSRPLVLENLSPGTHTLRAFASRPWHESFKNEGAYAQVTFHVYTKTDENQPNLDQPLLTYSRPQGTYGAEPVMLDFYLTNAPLHLVAQEDSQDDIPDWRIRVTVNGNEFILDQWEPLYLEGFKPGKNWVKLDYIDEQGNPVNNLYSNTARLITVEPGGKDGLSRIVRGDVSIEEARAIADPTYTYTPLAPLAPVAVPTPEPAIPDELAIPDRPSPKPLATPSPEPPPTPVATPIPVVPVPLPVPVMTPILKPKPAVPLVPAPARDLAPVPAPSPEPSPAIAPRVKRPSTKSPSLLRPRSTPKSNAAGDNAAPVLSAPSRAKTLSPAAPKSPEVIKFPEATKSPKATQSSQDEPAAVPVKAILSPLSPSADAPSAGSQPAIAPGGKTAAEKTNASPSNFQGLLNRFRQKADDLRQKAMELKEQAATLKVPTFQDLQQPDRRSEPPGARATIAPVQNPVQDPAQD
jgi:hypothetical protein